MDDLGSCPFCYKPVEVAQESYSSYIVICKGTCDYYLTNPMAGKTPEEAIEKFNQFKIELKLGAELWGSKIKNGITED